MKYFMLKFAISGKGGISNRSMHFFPTVGYMKLITVTIFQMLLGRCVSVFVWEENGVM